MLINKLDNVEVDLSTGHKQAIRDIAQGENIIKYGFPIGHATRDIKKGERVHTDNVKTNLGDNVEYTYEPEFNELEEVREQFFMGYEREDGSVGIRNDIWIVNTVCCVNNTAKIIAQRTGAKYFPHPYGCSQLGDDQTVTQFILKGMINHPNAGGVLVLGLGCENNNIEEMKKMLGQVNEKRVKFLAAQDCEDEIEEAVKLIDELKAYASTFERKKISAKRLVVGLKCGGSDGFSGITANPLVGRFSDKLISMGGSCVLTEVPEMFGAEHLLMKRAENRQVFDKTVSLINNFKDYFRRYNQVIYENPSPGNKAGGITTLEEKSLGCVQKGGSAKVVDVIDYGDKVTKNGLTLLNGPGNDDVACTNLMASGAHLILFTTGRGTPLGTCVPTLKISTNTALAEKKKNWIDFDAGRVLEGNDCTDELFGLVLETASGKQAKNEIFGYEEIAIFKDGVTL